MSVSLKKIFGLSKADKPEGKIAQTYKVEKTAAETKPAASPKHGDDSGVCCGSCSN